MDLLTEEILDRDSRISLNDARRAAASAFRWIGDGIRWYWESARLCYVYGNGRNGGLYISDDGSISMNT